MEAQNNNTEGTDRIPTDIHKKESRIWALYLKNLLNAVNGSRIAPEAWTKAVFVLIYKKGRENPSNYRPISFLDAGGKIYTRAILAHLDVWVHETEQKNTLQAGSQSRISTVDQCFHLQLLVDKHVHMQKMYLCVMFVDLQTAFNSIPHVTLWNTHKGPLELIRAC